MAFSISEIGKDTAKATQTTTQLFRFGLEAAALYTFQSTSVFYPRFGRTVVSQGLGCERNVLGPITAADHTRGSELTGSTTSQTIVKIEIKYDVVAHAYISDEDSEQASYNPVTYIGKATGAAVTNKLEKQYAKLLCECCANVTAYGQNAIFPFSNAGNVVMAGTAAVTGTTSKPAVKATPDQAVLGIHQAIATMQDRGYSLSQLQGFVSPKGHALILPSDYVASKDLGGMASVGTGHILQLHGIPIYITTSFPTTEETSTSTSTNLGGTSGTPRNWKNLICIVTTNDTLHGCHYNKLIHTEVSRVPTHLTTLVSNRIVYGVEVLRRGGAVAVFSEAAF